MIFIQQRLHLTDCVFESLPEIIHMVRSPLAVLGSGRQSQISILPLNHEAGGIQYSAVLPS